MSSGSISAVVNILLKFNDFPNGGRYFD